MKNYGFKKDKRVKLIESYNNAVLGRVLIEDSSRTAGYPQIYFAWVVWDKEGKFQGSLGSKDEYLMRFDLEKRKTK